MKRDLSKVLLDSKEGAEALFAFARSHNLVLNEYHEKLAKKYGVNVDGVIIARSI